jgi:D-aminopeptidase
MMAQDGMARAIVPSHTPMDGDLVFGVSTGNGKPLDLNDFMETGAAASQTLARAIARAVYEATPASGDLLPTYR